MEAFWIFQSLSEEAIANKFMYLARAIFFPAEVICLYI